MLNKWPKSGQKWRIFADSVIRPTSPKLRPNRFGRKWPKLRPKLRFRSYTNKNNTSVNPMIVYAQKRVTLQSFFAKWFHIKFRGDGLWVLLKNKLYENNGMWYRSVGFTNRWKILIFWSVVKVCGWSVVCGFYCYP